MDACRQCKQRSTIPYAGSPLPGFWVNPERRRERLPTLGTCRREDRSFLHHAMRIGRPLDPLNGRSEVRVAKSHAAIFVRHGLTSANGVCELFRLR